MPVGLQPEPVSLPLHGGQSPTGEVNGRDIQETHTDVEDVFSDGDQTPILKRKTYLSTPKQDQGAVTDTEDLDYSGDENDILQEKKNLPTVQELGIVTEPVREVINLTEGYAREASPFLSDSEAEHEDLQGRHKKSLLKVESQDRLELPSGEDDEEAVTDVEDMDVSGDEVEVGIEIGEDSLPAHYLDQSDGVLDHEVIKARSKTQKIFVPKDGGDSTDDEGLKRRKQVKRKSKTALKVEAQEGGTTDVEDLVLSDKGESKQQSVGKASDIEKVRKKKQVRRKVVTKNSASKSLNIPPTDSRGSTDVEMLTGDEDEEIWEEEDEFGLTVPDNEPAGVVTDTEDIDASDTEDVADFCAEPVERLEPLMLPEPHAEKIKISEVEEPHVEESGDNTDEEGFELDEKDDEKPLVPRKIVTHDPIIIVTRESLEVEEPCESALTDTEDMDIDEKEEEEVLQDISGRIPEEGEIYTIKEMDLNLGKVTKKELMKDVDAELKERIKEAEKLGLTLQEALEDDALTDVEDLDDDGTVIKKAPVKVKVTKRDSQTDEDSVIETDSEDEEPEPPKHKRKGKRLPIVPQISEVRFVETDHGPLSIIITPDNLEEPGNVIKDQVTNVVFLDSEDKEEPTTDVEDIGSSDEEDGKVKITKPKGDKEPLTDVEDLDIDPSEVHPRPRSPLPPNIHYSVLSSPKRELVQIKEDKYGVPQVTIRKLGKDELLVSDMEDLGVTDTEDIEVSEEEALRLAGVTEGSTSDFELPDSGSIEVSSKIMEKSGGLSVEPEEDGGSTDVEELPLTRKPRRKGKNRNKLGASAQDAESHTDVEILSDQDDKGKLAVAQESREGHTDVEDFETSEAEELEVPGREDAPTPDIISNAAIKRTVILKEGPDGVTQTEEAEVAPPRSLLAVSGNEVECITDVEDMEASGAEDEDAHPEHPAVDLPEHSSTVDISVKSNIPVNAEEAKQIKENLLLPEDNFNNLTDVESIGDGEGNRCASNLSLLSGQQLTYAVECCTVEELPYPSLPSTDPKLCVRPELSLESDPYCAELTNPLVVEAELEQVYYHAPQEEPEQSEVEMEASNGCVVRRRQVVASTCQAREIRRFWSLDRNSPLQQSELTEFATLSTHKKGFKTILYLEQPNLLDTISISDTLCDSNCFRNERLLDFDSSSIDSFDDHFSYRDSDIVTVVDRFSQESGSSFDDLPSPHLSSIDDIPSPHLSSIGSSGVLDSLCSLRSFNSDILFSESPVCSSPQPDILSSKTGSSELRMCTQASPHGSIGSFISSQSRSSGSDQNQGNLVSSQHVLDTSERLSRDIAEEDFIVAVQSPSEIREGIGVECHGGVTTECTQGYATHCLDVSARQSVQDSSHLECSGVFTECVKGYATECIESIELESANEFCTDFEEVPAIVCLRNSPTECIQRSVTEWIVERQTSGNVNSRHKIGEQPVSNLKDPYMIYNQEPVRTGGKPSTKSISESLTVPGLPLSTLSSENICSDLQTKLASQEVDLVRHKGNTSQTSEMNAVGNVEGVTVPVLVVSSRVSGVSLEDSGAHMHEASGSFTASIDTEEMKSNRAGGGERESVSRADSVLGLEEQALLSLTRNDSDTQEKIASQENAFALLDLHAYSQLHNVDMRKVSSDSDKKYDFAVSYPAKVVLPTGRHTLPRTVRQVKAKASPTTFLQPSEGRESGKTSKDFGGVKGLIDQWEVIVREESRRSLPASPAVGRRIIPPFEGKVQRRWSQCESEGKNLGNCERLKTIERTNETSVGKNSKGDEYESNVVEEVASVCDIIQQFEGRVGRSGKFSAHRKRLRCGSQSPASRSPSHPRRVATVKPLCEPQLQPQQIYVAQEGQHQEHMQALVGSHLSSGFVPRVMEALSVTKSSQEVQQVGSPDASVPYPEGTHEATHLAEQPTATLSHDQGSGLHGGCREVQGMEWEGKSVDSMFTDTVVQAKHSRLPAVDTREGVVPISSSSSIHPSAAPLLSSTSLWSDLPHPTDIQPQSETSQDLIQQYPKVHLNLDPSPVHESHSFEPQSFDRSPSSAAKLSDNYLEKGFTSNVSITRSSNVVASPSITSLQSESVAPFTATDEAFPASITFNTSSALISIGPVSPTEDSSEDHAEIERTSTELSPDSVRFEQDILDTRTEDEAPDLDDDLLPASPVVGPESDRVFSVEATEDTDITTPMEMRDSHTERDATASNLESADDKDGSDAKSDLDKDQLVKETEDGSFSYLVHDVEETEDRARSLEEKVKSQEIDPATAKSEAEVIMNTVSDIREALGEGRDENSVQYKNGVEDIQARISSITDCIAQVLHRLHLKDPDYSNFWSRNDSRVATRTDSTIVETSSPEDGTSPSDSNVRDQSFSDLLDSDDINRDSLEDEFDRLAAELSASPKEEFVHEMPAKSTITCDPSNVLVSSVSSSNVYPSVPPDALQATQREPGLGVEEMSSVVESYTIDGSDPITDPYTTTTTTTMYDPDPIVTTHTTRIITRTEGEDGEIKEEIYEEY